MYMKGNIIKKIALITCLALLISSCAKQSKSETISTGSASPTDPSVIQTVIPSTTSTQDIVQNSCVELQNSTEPIQAQGDILLEALSGNYIFMNLTTSEITGIPEQAGGRYFPLVSPDMKYLIGETCTDDKCQYVVRTVDGVINTIPIQEYWVLQQWLDNERVVILTENEPHDVLILNPFTQQIDKIKLYLSNPFSIFRGGNESLIPVNPNQTLSKVFYYDKTSGGRLVLWDVNQKITLASLPYTLNEFSSFDSLPWSPDRKSYAIAFPEDSAPNELYSVDMNGRITQLTFFNKKYPFANITLPVWSPDNQHIAFWIKIGNAQDTNSDDLAQYLAIIDIKTLETKIYCQKFSTPRYPVYWNSDGTQLITNNRAVQDNILIDLANLIKTNIDTQNRSVKGWMMP